MNLKNKKENAAEIIEKRSRKLKEIDYLPRTCDIIFKKIFGDYKNTNILKNFLKAILDLPEDEYEILEISDSHSKTEDVKIDGDLNLIADMESILDIKLLTKNKKRIDVEMQVKKSPIMCNRVVKYFSDMLNEQIRVGSKRESLTTEKKYKSLKKVILIEITAKHTMYKDKRYWHSFHINEDFDPKIRFSDLLEIHILELPKLTNDDGSNLWNWMKFLKTDSKEDINMLAQRNTAIKEAVYVLEELSESRKVRDAVRRREAFLQDQEAREEEKFNKGIQIGKAEGKAEGEQIGLEKGRAEMKVEREIEIARNLLKLNLTNEQISQSTGLSIEQIQSLK